MPIIKLLGDDHWADSGSDIFRCKPRRLLLSFRKGVVGQFDVEAALRRHLARYRRHSIKLTHYPKGGALTLKSHFLLKCSDPLGLTEDS
jgi:hypothetical protein